MKNGRGKTLRGLNSRASGQSYLNGWVLTYNHFRDHESLRGKTPAENAREGSPFESWEDVVESSARQYYTVRPDLFEPPKPEGKARRSRRSQSASTIPSRQLQPAVNAENGRPAKAAPQTARADYGVSPVLHKQRVTTPETVKANGAGRGRRD